MRARRTHVLRNAVISSFALLAYPLWWMWPVFFTFPRQRIGARLGDTYSAEQFVYTLQSGKTTFWSLVAGTEEQVGLFRLEWLSQILQWGFLGLASRVLSPIDATHALILCGWFASGIAVLWLMRSFSQPLFLSIVAAVTVQMLPMFRYWSALHTSFMFSGLALLPICNLYSRLKYRTTDFNWSTITRALLPIFVLAFLDAGLAYFSSLLMIVGLLILVCDFSVPRDARIKLLTLLFASAIGSAICSWLLINVFGDDGSVNRRRILQPDEISTAPLRSLWSNGWDIFYGNLPVFVGIPILLGFVLRVVFSDRQTASWTVFVTASVFLALPTSFFGFTLDFPGVVLRSIVPIFRFYDRLGAIAAILVVIYALHRPRYSRTNNKMQPTYSVIAYLLLPMALISLQPWAARGITDDSVNAQGITSAAPKATSRVLGVNSPPYISGFPIVQFANNWTQAYHVSRSGSQFRQRLCSAGFTHVLVNGATDVPWRDLQLTSAYSTKGWVSFSDRRYFVPVGHGEWEDRDSPISSRKKSLTLYEVQGCEKLPTLPLGINDVPVEVENDGILVRQQGTEYFGGEVFAVSPRVIVTPVDSRRHEKLRWSMLIGVADGYSEDSITVQVAGRRSESRRAIQVRPGQRELVVIETTYPHQLLLETPANSSSDYYFALSQFEVRPD